VGGVTECLWYTGSQENARLGWPECRRVRISASERTQRGCDKSRGTSREMPERMIALPALGFLGLGAMGGPMVRNLLRTGYAVRAFDTDPERLARCVADGASGVVDAAGTVRDAAVLLTSLPSSDAFVHVAGEILLPHAEAGQVFIDLGTTTPPETRRLAALFAAKGAVLLDVPVSGGPGGVETRTLRMFAGGEPAILERCRPILEALGGPNFLTYCGPSGAGQVVKGVNQLAMGLGAAAYLEAVAFGVRAGVDAAVIGTAVGGLEGWRGQLGGIARRIVEEQGKEVGVKFRELPYFLREAAEQGFELPLTQVLYAFCAAGEPIVVEDNRPAPSFWHELLLRGVTENTAPQEDA
jgi:3-hydroxyisobutyrate dehydrogenase-like beta-hydroxyacid dehydrogenase